MLEKIKRIIEGNGRKEIGAIKNKNKLETEGT